MIQRMCRHRAESNLAFHTPNRTKAIALDRLWCGSRRRIVLTKRTIANTDELLLGATTRALLWLRTARLCFGSTIADIRPSGENRRADHHCREQRAVQSVFARSSHSVKILKFFPSSSFLGTQASSACRLSGRLSAVLRQRTRIALDGESRRQSVNLQSSTHRSPADIVSADANGKAEGFSDG